MPLEFSPLRTNMFNMSYSHVGDMKLKLLNMVVKKWPFPSTDKLKILEIIGRDGSFKDIIKLSPEYKYTLSTSIEDIQASENDANKPIVIPNFRPEFEGPDENNNRRMTARKLKKIGKRKDPEVLKARFIKAETAKRKRKGVRSVEFKMTYESDDGLLYGVSFTVYRNGSLRMSGKYIEDENVHRVVQDFLFAKYDVPKNTMTFNNLTASFAMNAKPDLRRLVAAAPKPNVSNKNIIQKTGKLKKTVERETPRMVRGIANIPLGSGILRVGASGRCQLVRIAGPSNINSTFREAKAFLSGVVRGPFRAMPNQTNPLTKAEKYASGEKAPNVLRRGTTCPKSKRPVPYSFQGKCPSAGMYVKPNPQGQPCCYKIPKSAVYSKSKIAQAYKKAGVKIPENVKNMFGLEDTVNNALSNTTHSSNKNFINVFNDPTINQTYINNMDRLLNAKKSKRVNKNGMWTLRTKPGAKAKFEDPMTVASLITKARGRTNWHIPNVSQMKIGTRQCTRYTKVALMDIAKRLNIIEAKPSMKKDVLCHLIRKATHGTRVNKTTTGSSGGLMAVVVKDTGARGDKNRAITGNGLRLRIGARDAITFPVGKLREFAGQLGAGAGRNALSRDALVGLIADLTDAKRRNIKRTAANRKRNANDQAAVRAVDNARRAEEIANRAMANAEREYTSRLRNLNLVDRRGRGQMNAVMTPVMYLNLAENRNRRDAMRQNVITMAKNAMKRDRLRPIDFEKTAGGQQKGVIKGFMKAFETEVEAKYRPIYYEMLAGGNSTVQNKVKTFANTIPDGKKSKPSLKQIRIFAERLKKKPVKN